MSIETKDYEFHKILPTKIRRIQTSPNKKVGGLLELNVRVFRHRREQGFEERICSAHTAFGRFDSCIIQKMTDNGSSFRRAVHYSS